MRPLPRPGGIPCDGGWAFEIKYDGFRAFISTEDGLRAAVADGTWRPASPAWPNCLPASSSTANSSRTTSEVQHRVEGIVAKRRDGIYRSGYRGWMKVKNPSYWRRESEIELMHRPRERVAAAWR
jgi:ATP-dependent DNA ligase